MIKSSDVRRLGNLSIFSIAIGLMAGNVFAQECEVKIGAAGPMTGGAASWGQALKTGAEFAVAQTNQAGGLQIGSKKCKVTLFSFDSQYTAAGAAAAANYLASQNVKAIVGPLGSPEMTGVKPIAKRNGQVTTTTSFASDAMSPEYPLSFHVLAGPVVWGDAIVKEAKNRFKFSSVVIVGPNDQGGTDGSVVLEKAYKANGVRPMVEYYQRGTTNFAAIATRIMSLNPDSVELATMPPGDTAILTKQLMEAGFQGVLGRLGGSGSTDIIKGAGGVEKMKGFYWLELVALDDPKIKSMKADFEKVMKTPMPDNTIIYSYTTAANMLLKAISAAGTDQDGEKIAAALRKLPAEMPYMGKGVWRGKAQYGINQQMAFPLGLGLIANGKSLGVAKIEVSAE